MDTYHNSNFGHALAMASIVLTSRQPHEDGEAPEPPRRAQQATLVADADENDFPQRA